MVFPADSNEMTKIVHIAKARVDFTIIGNVITAVYPRTEKNRIEPDVIDIEFGDERDFVGDVAK